MQSVGRAGGAVVEEVRRQFREMPGIMLGTAKARVRHDGRHRHPRCTQRDGRSRRSSRSGFPLIVVLLTVLHVLPGAAGAQIMGGILIGSIVTGLFLASAMTSGGGAWDNAKKYIEDGNFGGKGSPAHAAAVTGDTVGDPYKDTAGPAINPMIKVLNIVALLLVGLPGLSSSRSRSATHKESRLLVAAGFLYVLTARSLLRPGRAVGPNDLDDGAAQGRRSGVGDVVVEREVVADRRAGRERSDVGDAAQVVALRVAVGNGEGDILRRLGSVVHVADVRAAGLGAHRPWA